MISSVPPGYFSFFLKGFCLTQLDPEKGLHWKYWASIG